MKSIYIYIYTYPWTAHRNSWQKMLGLRSGDTFAHEFHQSYRTNGPSMIEERHVNMGFVGLSGFSMG